MIDVHHALLVARRGVLREDDAAVLVDQRQAQIGAALALVVEAARDVRQLAAGAIELARYHTGDGRGFVTRGLRGNFDSARLDAIYDHQAQPERKRADNQRERQEDKSRSQGASKNPSARHTVPHRSLDIRFGQDCLPARRHSGMSAIEQNAIIKIFSVAAVVFLPPTLVASVYGMNFHHMPELDWAYGYPTAIGLMALSAIIPLIYFRRKGWL